MNGQPSKTLPSLVEHLHLKTGIRILYFWSTKEGPYHGLPRHLAQGRLPPLHVLGWGRRHLLRLGGRGQRLLLGLGGRGRRHLLPPHFLDGSLDAMRLLEKGGALGFTSWWPEMVVLRFSWCRGWWSSWPVRIYIDKTANCHAVGHAPRNPCPLRRALGHKNRVVTRRRVTVHILFKIPNAQLLLWVVRFLKKQWIVRIFINLYNLYNWYPLTIINFISLFMQAAHIM
jgi:hypothetical protein